MHSSPHITMMVLMAMAMPGPNVEAGRVAG
jgi:hypothetical protein